MCSNKWVLKQDDNGKIICRVDDTVDCCYEDMVDLSNATKKEIALCDKIYDEIGRIAFMTGDSDCDACPWRKELDALRIIRTLSECYKITFVGNGYNKQYSLI